MANVPSGRALSAASSGIVASAAITTGIVKRRSMRSADDIPASFDGCRNEPPRRPRRSAVTAESGLRKYRYRDSNPGFRRERAAS